MQEHVVVEEHVIRSGGKYPPPGTGGQPGPRPVRNMAWHPQTHTHYIQLKNTDKFTGKIRKNTWKVSKL